MEGAVVAQVARQLPEDKLVVVRVHVVKVANDVALLHLQPQQYRHSYHMLISMLICMLAA